MKFLTNNYLLNLSLFILSSCSSKWDPNHQFEQQAASIKFKQEQHNIRIEAEARKGIRSLESEILLKLQIGVKIYELNQLLGVEYTILAQNISNNQFWESRLYKWENIVKSKWSLNSLEYNLSEKNRDFLILTVNQDRVVNIEYL